MFLHAGPLVEVISVIVLQPVCGDVQGRDVRHVAILRAEVEGEAGGESCAGVLTLCDRQAALNLQVVFVDEGFWVLHVAATEANTV